jgi:O-antigen ligase
MLALLLTLLAMVVLPQTKLEIESVPFLVCAAIAVAFAAASRIRQVHSKAGLVIIAFLATLFFHVGFVFTDTVTVAEYVRGLIPFLFLGFFFVTIRLANLQNFHRLYFGLIAVGLIYALENVILLPKVLSGEIWRSTYVNSNHNIPLPLVGFHFCVALALSRRLRFGMRTGLMFLAALMLLSSFLTGTRSLIISSLFPLIILPFTEASSLKKWARYGVALALLATIFLFVPIEPILRGARIGGTQEGSIDTRMQENTVALSLITDSPLIGNGLGFRFATTGLYYQATKVGYVHNSLLYLLMDFGIFGLLYFAAPVCAVLSLRLVRSGPHREHATGIVMALLALSMDSLGFAMVRLMHFNLVFAVLIGMLEVLKRDYAFAWRTARFRMVRFSFPAATRRGTLPAATGV